MIVRKRRPPISREELRRRIKEMQALPYYFAEVFDADGQRVGPIVRPFGVGPWFFRVSMLAKGAALDFGLNGPTEGDTLEEVIANCEAAGLTVKLLEGVAVGS